MSLGLRNLTFKALPNFLAFTERQFLADHLCRLSTIHSLRLPSSAGATGQPRLRR